MTNGWYRVWVYSIIGIVQFRYSSTIRTYRMEDHCAGEITTLQARLTLHVQAKNDECRVTIEASDRNIMFYFETFNISCNTGFLQVYDGRPGIEELQELEYICGQVVPEEVFTTRTKYLTIMYTRRHPQDSGEEFSLIVTAFRTGSCPDYRHLCDNGRCISKDLLCNGVQSCGDGSGCPTVWSAVAVLGVVLGCVVIVCVVAVFVILISICRRRQELHARYMLQPQPRMNGITNPVYDPMAIGY